MGAHEDRIRAMKFAYPEYIPVSVGLLPATWMRYREALSEIATRHPILFGDYKKEGHNYDTVSGFYVEGRKTDEWGCVWDSVRAGCDSMCIVHPIPHRAMVNQFASPPPGAGLPHGFMYMRLFYLRGFEELMIDFAEKPPELQKLIDIVYRYNRGELKRILRDGVAEIMHFGDDLGMQTSLPISPKTWRKYLTPCYKQLYQMVHAAGGHVYMHTDGHIIPIIRDLIRAGVNIVNPQIRANGLDNLVRECKGKICVALDLDRQMFPFCKPSDIDGHILEAVTQLGSPQGGLWLQAECGPDVPLETIEAICVALEKHRGHFTK